MDLKLLRNHEKKRHLFDSHFILGLYFLILPNPTVIIGVIIGFNILFCYIKSKSHAYQVDFFLPNRAMSVLFDVNK